MYKMVCSFCIVVLLLTLNSCIREDLSGCPTNYLVKVTVKDKNYSNIGSFSQLSRVNENLPFSNYSGTIYYIVKNAVTGAVVQESSVISPVGTNTDYSIELKNLPYGDYHIEAWGNLTSDVPVGTLHKDGTEYTDLYTATGAFSFQPGTEAATLELHRAKGDVVVFCTNFPSNVTRIEMNVSPVYQWVDANLNFSGSTQVSKTVAVTPINTLFAAPTIPGVPAKLKVKFYTDNSSTPILIVPDTDIEIQPNKISGMLVDYNVAAGAWEIWVSIQGEWTLIHHLDIQLVVS